MSVESIRERVGRYQPKCQYVHIFKNGRSAGRCDRTAWYHDAGIINRRKAHPFTYDPAMDTSDMAAMRALLAVAEAVAMMPTPIALNGCCTFCDAVMNVERMTEDGFWPHEADCPLGNAHRALAAVEALP